ncbi:hypothetical protein EBT16_10450, partial [bacterium]|nr:hypothetical protein [bacterium]
KHFIKMETAKDLRVEDVEKELARQKRSLHEIKETIAHHIMDARIIDACFPNWPGKNNESLKTYHSLGWSPLK